MVKTPSWVLTAMVSGTDQLAPPWVNNIKRPKTNKFSNRYFYCTKGMVYLKICHLHLLPLWITGVMSLQSLVKQLLPWWITVVVSLYAHVKQLLPLWVTAVVGGQDTIMGTNCDGVSNGSVTLSLGE